MTCKHCTFNRWIHPYDSDNKPFVCGEGYGGGNYVIASEVGYFWLAEYYYDNGMIEITHCPYCGEKLVTPPKEVFRKAQAEWRIERNKTRVEEIDAEIAKLQKEKRSYEQ